MNTSKCPIQGDCGGTGWLWRGGSDYPYPEPPEWYPCKCNPRADGDPETLMVELRRAVVPAYVSMDADDAPF